MKTTLILAGKTKVHCMRLFRVLPGPRYLVPFLYNLMSTSPGSHKLNLEQRVPGKNFRQAHTLYARHDMYMSNLLCYGQIYKHVNYTHN